MKKAFTLLEFVFVMLILGILASLSFSFANQNKNDAKLLKLKIDYEMLNSALVLMRTQAELKQINAFSPNLDEAKINTQKEKLFYCQTSQNCTYSLLHAPIYSSFNAWMKIAPNRYRFFLNAKEWVDFFYNANFAILECLSEKYCKELL
ncbi:prepilin-type N-terminal cleavage/methylation domain-containing protein [Campylobacter coli]|nr:prepilin-type N-terminal cleavage/methylation domain-containing protein [Campylobacter coli]